MFLAAFTSALHAYPQAVHRKAAWLSAQSARLTRSQAGCVEHLPGRADELAASLTPYREMTVVREFSEFRAGWQ
jgi:hypothetical protein